MNGELDMTAAEYVLGTLGPAERASFERRIATDELARRAVDEWTRRLSPLAVAGHEVEPPAEVWLKVERQIAEPLAANENIAEGLRRSVTGWRRAFMAASVLAASLAAFVVYRELPASQHPAPIYVAMLGRGGERPALIVDVNPATKSAYIIPLAAEQPAGRSLELWFIASGQKPVSMGLVRTQGERVELPAGAKLENASFAVSVEPEGGSQTGAPSGPVVYSGQLLNGS